jgi:ligand-binding sensor domain-containing protein/serine phosphatase RsbU (regulator of sigma subunit)
MIKKIFFLSYIVLVSNLIYTQNELPVNSTDKTSVNKWVIAKVNDSIDTKKIIKSEDYFGSIDKNQIKSLNLSKFNNVTFSLYQIFEEINFNNTFIIASNIESKTEFKYSFIYSNVDMASEIYINGEKAKLPFGTYNLNFEHLLKKGKNSIIIIGKPNGNYKSRFNLKINDKNLSKIKIKILKKNLEPYKNGFFGLKNEKVFRFFNLDKNGEYTISVNPGNYLIGSNYSEFYKWSSEFNISENQVKEIKLILNQRSRISGNISTYDGKNPHPGINVSLVNANSNEIFGISVSDNSGNYSFDPPNGDWYVKISSKHSDDIYFSDNGKKTIFKINNNTKSIKNINFEIPTQINTSWGKVTMFNGMLSNSIIKSIISKKDILYFATFNGLSVYDGLNVKNYNYVNGLPNDPIREIFEDRNGFIWLGYATRGLIKWKDGEIINHFTIKDGLPSNIIGAINEDNEGNILIGTSKGLAVLENKKFTNYNFTSGIGDGNIQCITVIGNNIWIGTGNGLSIFSKGIIKPIYIETFTNLTWGGYFINDIKKDNDNNIWLGTASGLIKYDGVKFKFYSIFDGLPSNSIIDIHVDQNSLLIGTQSGLCRFKDNQFNTIISLEKEGLKGIRISSIDKTKDGMYFISTNMNGVFFYDPNSINTITSNEGFKVSETVNDIKVGKDGVIWAGALNGLYKIENGIITNYYNKSNSNMPRNLVLDIEIDSDGSMWLVQKNHITRFYENSFENMTKKIGVSNTQVIDLEFDNDGTMWIATTSGLGKFKNDSLTIYKESDGLVRPLFSSVSVSQPCAVTIGRNNEVIYSTYGSGFSIFNGTKFKNFSTKNGLANDKVEEIAVDSKNNYWIALDGSGVQMYNGIEFKNYTMENGLSSDESYTIFVDDFDKVFVGSWHGGVNYFNGKIWNSLDSRDGLLNNTVKSLYGINGNKYWFGSYGGITSYEPKIQTPYIKISSIETPNGFYNSLNDMENNKQKFVSDTRSKFTLNSTSFNTKKEKQKYLVKITRKSKTESLIISSNEYVFQPNKTGKYTLEFQSVDRDMNYSTPLKINISVVGPWYKNMATAIPFWGFLVLLISISGYSSNKYLSQRRYTAKLKEESRIRLEEKNKEIVDSINYAKRIQDAMMTSEGYRKSVIPKSFTFFKPKDVVSGDFYWVFKDKQENIFFTVADCTGHGVPGAFMSMIGTSLLNEIVVEKGISDTNKILDEMRTQIIKSLNQDSEDDQKDGMDISICRLNMKKKTLEFSGAHNPLLIVSGNEISTYKGDSQAVGLETLEMKPFTKHSIKLKKDDMIYIYSDGYQDQFGGDNGKKYMTANFKKLLLKISKEDEKKQNKLLEIELANWMQKEEQIDDICVMGVRV